LICIVCRNIGGAGSVAGVARAHALALTQLGERVCVVSESMPSSLSKLLCWEVLVPDARPLRRYGHVVTEWFFAQRAALEIVEKLRQGHTINWVICHSHVVAWRIAKKIGTKPKPRLALYVHGVIFDRPRNTYHWTLERTYRFCTPRAHRSCDIVIANSPHIESRVRRLGARKTATVRAPVEFCDGAMESTGQVRSLENSAQLLFVGRLSIEKGLATLLRALALIKHHRPSMSLTVVGDGPLRIQLEQLARDLGIARCVNFVGQQQKSEVDRSMRSHGLLCVPSLDEPQGLVVPEAWIAGLPVVASSTGGLANYIDNGRNGVLVADYTNPSAWADALESITRPSDQTYERLVDGVRSTDLSPYLPAEVGREIKRVLQSNLESLNDCYEGL
jgi:glycosyltransferase involved in cell wall biosynthesis